MTDILNLQVKDESLKNVMANNPFYIDIKGSVNICLIRCGQEIDQCNSVNFSTMTNYGKILVLNPNTTKQTKCNIKLAFDTTNDNSDNKGDANYKFEKAFFTVPSLHKLNGEIFDMETFLVFSSIQKNGNILYVCMCSLSMGTDMVQSGDWKLLNYKLMNELFSTNNKIPDIYGTNEIDGIPNPIDLNNFIPKEGSRNFYDYTHPLNTKVNFRVFQNPMAVSNTVLNLLKSKLTPGNIYTNFRTAISQTINPVDGLFFYFSEDLTDRYKSFKANESSNKLKDAKDVKDAKEVKEDYETISTAILEEQELHEKESFKKLKTDENKSLDVLEDESESEDNIDEKNKESFEDNKNNMQSIILVIFIIGFLVAYNWISTYLIFNIFAENKIISEENLPNCINDLATDNMLGIFV